MHLKDLTSILNDGDIIFSSIPNRLYKAVEEGTNSPTSHVGIAFKINNQWMVAESKVPFSRFSLLEAFVARSDNHWVSVKRVKQDLSERDVDSLKSQCHARMHKLYDFGFNYESGRQFCSKFVHEVFIEALGIEVGKKEYFADLIEKSPNGVTPFWYLWFFGQIPRTRITVTPHSQWDDRNLVEVY